jgi:hypothetical protein
MQHHANTTSRNVSRWHAFALLAVAFFMTIREPQPALAGTN